MTIDLPLSNEKPPRFDLGTCVATPGAIEAMYVAKVDPLTLLIRHVTGDWGDLCVEDHQANENALRQEARIFSKYVLDTDADVSVYVITEADRSSTTILLPSDY
ncbi:MAG: type I restriction endonuclease subunit M [Planctomycetota bacterium]